MLHPETYLNKVVVANATGGLQLWNIRTRYARAGGRGCMRRTADL